MDLLKDIQLPFRELKKGETLYDDIDLRASSIVDAQYERRPGYEQIPDICALPKLYSNQELIQAVTTGLPEYNPEAIKQMQAYEKKENLLLLQKAYYPLGHTFEVDYAVNAALVSSYMGREPRYSQRKEEPELAEHGIPGTVYSLRSGSVGRAFSFLVTGPSGSGKSVSIEQITNLYPKSIRHEIGNKEYVQIPILRATSMVGNMKELITAFAAQIDEILDTGTMHADQVRTRNVGMACNKLKEWIKRYHIGLLVIDEIQFMKFGEGSSSFENLVGIAEETGCALGLIGNREVHQKLCKYPRIISRVMLNRIEVGFAEEVSRGFFVNALKQLWEYQWTKERTELTEEIMRELIQDSMYNIAILKILLIRIQYKALKKFPKGGITAEYIHEISEQEFSEIRALILQDTPDSERKVLALFQKKSDSIRDDARTEAQKARMAALEQSHAGQFLAENEWKLGQVKTILMYFGYTETQIRRAVKMAADQNENLQYMDVSCIVDAAKKILESGHPDTKVKLPKQKTVDIKAEQAVREAMQKELGQIGGIA